MVIFRERWDGEFFFARTIGINGFSMDLQLAGDVFGLVRLSGALVCAGMLIGHAHSEKYDVKSTLLTHKVQKKNAILWKVRFTIPL